MGNAPQLRHPGSRKGLLAVSREVANPAGLAVDTMKLRHEHMVFTCTRPPGTYSPIWVPKALRPGT